MEQLHLMKDAGVIHQVERLEERRVFYVDVGHMDAETQKLFTQKLFTQKLFTQKQKDSFNRNTAGKENMEQEEMQSYPIVDKIEVGESNLSVETFNWTQDLKMTLSKSAIRESKISKPQIACQIGQQILDAIADPIQANTRKNNMEIPKGIHLAAESGHVFIMDDTPSPIKNDRTSEQFVRSFRFTLSDRLDTFLPIMAESMSINYTKKLLKVICFDMRDASHMHNTQQLVNHMPEELVLRTYDDKGDEIYQQVFSGIEVLKCTQKFFYGDNSIAKINFLLSYDAREVI